MTEGHRGSRLTDINISVTLHIKPINSQKDKIWLQ